MLILHIVVVVWDVDYLEIWPFFHKSSTTWREILSVWSYTSPISMTFQVRKKMDMAWEVSSGYILWGVLRYAKKAAAAIIIKCRRPLLFFMCQLFIAFYYLNSKEESTKRSPSQVCTTYIVFGTISVYSYFAKIFKRFLLIAIVLTLHKRKKI